MNQYTNTWQGYGAPMYMQEDPRTREKRMIKRQSIRTGLCILAFWFLEQIASFVVQSSKLLYGLYIGNESAREMIDVFYYLIIMFLPFLIAYLTMRPEDRNTLTLFEKSTSKPAALAAVVAGFMMCNVANFVTNQILSLMENLGFSVGGGTTESPQTVVQLVFSVMSIGLFPALIEEFALRGVVMQPLRRHGDRFAILMSAFVFALMHGNLSQFSFALIVGVAIGYFVIATGSIWVGVLIHMFNNLFSVSVNFLLEVRPTAADTYCNIVYSVSAVAGVIALVLFLKFCRRNRLQKSNGVMSAGERTAAYILTVPMVISIILMVVETVRLIHYEGS